MRYLPLNEINSCYINDFLYDLKNILDEGCYIGGKYVSEFEQKFGNIHNSNAIGVSNGTDALTLITKLLFTFDKKDPIYYPANTFIGSILGALQLGYNFIPYDIDLNTLNIKEDFIVPNDAAALIVVHLYGYGIKSIENLKNQCENKGILLIEDCSQSHFQKVNSKFVGTFGDVSFYSCYPGKNLGAIGDAGIILTDNIEIANKLKSLRNYGSNKKYYFDQQGFNHRMDAIQAAFLTRKLSNYEDEILARRYVAKTLLSINNNKLRMLNINENDSVWHIFPILVDNREEFITFLNKNNIESNIHYPNLVQDSVYNSNITNIDTPNAKYASEHVISIPCNSTLLNDNEKDLKELYNVLSKY